MSSARTTGRLPSLLVLVVTGIFFYLIGAYGTKTGQAQADRPGQAGTYQWYVEPAGKDDNTKETIHQIWILDTRNGNVYKFHYDKEAKTMSYKLLTEGRFEK